MQQPDFNLQTVLITDSVSGEINAHIKQNSYDRVFILADNNTAELCVPMLALDATLISIPAGEENKNLESAGKIWSQLLKNGASRKSLLINCGGGMISDIGAFCASTFMRGIAFINIPTSLLAMVDAAIGGKCGIDLHSHKNTVGTFTYPKAVYICPNFLKTLPLEQKKAAKAEMLKHGFISNYEHALAVAESNDVDAGLIEESVRIKSNIVLRDPQEKGERKTLNFGHSFAHAFESTALSEDQPILHGDAVAAGMICEAYLSQKQGLSESELKGICGLIQKTCNLPRFHDDHCDSVLEYMRTDKKNHSSKFLMSLLKAPGHGVFDIECSEDELRDAFAYYQSISRA